MRFFVLLFLFSTFSYAQVWESKNEWNGNYEKRYQESIKKIKKDIFINKKSYYYGLSADCADLVYFSRIKFSMENNLPFSVYLEDTKVSNLTKRFNSIKNKKERLFSFIKYIFRTEALIP